MQDDVLDGIFITEGEGRLRLPRERYTLLVHGGLRDAVRAAEVDCGASLEHAVAVTLPRVLPLPGWITTDLHVHTARSADAYVPDRARLDALKAADLNRVVLSDHRRIVTPDELPGGRTRPHRGHEVRIPDPDGLERSGGHINAFPLSAARPAGRGPPAGGAARRVAGPTAGRTRRGGASGSCCSSTTPGGSAS